MLHYRDLNINQKIKLCNGCGGGKYALFIPNFIFLADCCQHDFYYWRGGNLWDKIRGDYWFYYYMVIDAFKNKHYDLKLFYFLMATLYYIIVSVLGFIFFHWGERRTLKDLTIICNDKNNTRKVN